MDDEKIERLKVLLERLVEWEQSGYNVSPLRKEIEEFKKREGIEHLVFPIEVGHYKTPGEANSVYVSGQYVYVAAGYAGLHIIRIIR